MENDMAILSSLQNQRRIRIVTQRAAFTVAFLSCLLMHQVMIWAGAIKPDDSWGTVILNKLHWYILTSLVGAIIGACLGYFLMIRWLARRTDNS